MSVKCPFEKKRGQGGRGNRVRVGVRGKGETIQIPECEPVSVGEVAAGVAVSDAGEVLA